MMSKRSVGVGVLAALVTASPAFAQPRKLAQFDIPLLGISATVEPLAPVVPKNVASGVRIVVRAGNTNLSLADATRLLGAGFEARAELSGSGLRTTITLKPTGSPPADPLLLPIPALAVAGDYTLSNIRIVSSAGEPVLDVSPRSITVQVIDQVLITSVKTRPLTLAEIREKGIVLDSDDYLAFEFNIGLIVDSKAVTFSLPVAFNRQGVAVPQPTVAPSQPARANVELPSSPLPTIVPVMLEPVGIDALDLCAQLGGEFCGASPPSIRIPAVLVIPGNVGYLKQFFSAQVFVANGAPVGSGLSVRDIVATIHMPPGADADPDTADDPLALPELDRNGQTIVQPRSMGVRAVGLDGVPGTADDVGVLQPGEQGEAEFLLRGEKEGFHELSFDIAATMDGLITGPLELATKAAGGVLVRNPFFSMSFTVPSVIRRGEPFKLFATVTNIGQGIANDVGVTLDAGLLSGALLVGDATQRIDTLRTGDARTLEFDFVAQRTGQAVASYLAFEPGAAASGELRFALAVDERGVPLSPDTLVLPADVGHLPADVVQAAMRVLGQAWSNANAPTGTLPQGVLRITKTVATEKALALAEAGLRVTLGQPLGDALRDIGIDFYGGSPLDPAFDQLLRSTEAGHHLTRTLGAALAEAQAAAGGATAYERVVADVAASGPGVLTLAVGNGAGGAPLDLAVTDASGHRSVSESASSTLPASEVPGAVLVPLGAPGSSGILGIITDPSNGPYVLEFAGREAGPYQLSLTVPMSGGSLLRATIDGVAASGSRGRLMFDPAAPVDLTLQEDLDGDGAFESSRSLNTERLAPTGPHLVSATMVGPETVGGASPFGFNAALLFDRVVNPATADAPARYSIPNNSVQNAKRQLSGRIVFVSLNQPEGPYVATTVRAAGVTDLRDTVGPDTTVALRSLLADPGAVVSGRVLGADGAPVSSATVTYENNANWTCLDDPWSGGESRVGFSSVPVTPDGRFEFRYVRRDACGYPFEIATTDPQSGALRNQVRYVRASGERILLDIALTGRGGVAGTVYSLTGAPVPGARVVVVSGTDPSSGAVATSDGEGHYAVQGIIVGPVAVSAVRGISAGRNAGRIDLTGTTATVDVTLDGGTVRVSGSVLKLEGAVTAPLPGATVAFAVADSGPVAATTTAADGSYAFDGMPVGAFRVTAYPDGIPSGYIDGVGAAGDQKTGLNIVVVIPDTTPGSPDNRFGTVRGIVRSATGALVPGAIVTIGGRGVESGQDGTFEILGVSVLPGVDQTVLARSRDGLRSGTAVARISGPGQIVEGVSIALSGMGSMVVTVLDADGAPMGGQVVGLLWHCSSACGCSPKTTGPDGKVVYEGLPLGTVAAKAVRTGVDFTDVAEGAATITREGDAAAVTLQFRGTGSVAGRVLDHNGLPAFGAVVDLMAPVFNEGSCGLSRQRSQSVRTGVQGTFQFMAVGVGTVEVVASHPFYPTVSTQGVLRQSGQRVDLELSFKKAPSIIAGELSGMVFRPDGVTPAGTGVQVTVSGAIPSVTITTDVEGRFRFAKVFPEGGYTINATDPATGSLAQDAIYLRAEQDATHDMRFLGRGTVWVHVLDALDRPVAKAFVRLRETSYPQRSFEAALDESSLGVATFTGVFEGPFSVEVSDPFARGGRASGTLPKDGDSIDVTVRVTTTGTVEGHFLRPDGSPIPYATVLLKSGGRTIGQMTSEGAGDIGAFRFDYVPAGTVEVVATDPATARSGSSMGAIDQEGQVLTLDVHARSLGIVEGLVTGNGLPEPGANMTVVSGEYRASTISDSVGRYQIKGVPEGLVFVTASLGNGFLAGTASAKLIGEGTVLSLDVALRDAGQVTGKVLDADGVSPAPLSVVTISVGGTGGGSFSIATSAEGMFAFDRVPSGLATLSADVLSSIDEARGSADVPPGGTAHVTLVLNGLGEVAGHATTQSGAPAVGDVSVTANGTLAFSAVARTDDTGAFVFKAVPAGPVTASLAVAAEGFVLRGTASGTVVNKQTTVLDVRVQPSGTVTGTVVRPDGSTPAFGVEIRLILDGGRGTFTRYSRDDGRFEAKGVPLGGFSLQFRDPFSGGVFYLRNLALTTDEEVLDVGTVAEHAELSVLSFDPPDGAANVALNRAVHVAFSDPLASAAGVVVSNGAVPVPLASSLSGDGFTVTLTGTLPDSAELTIAATTAVTDVFGRHPLETVTSRFRTVDLSPPSVTAVSPAPAAIQVPADAVLTVTFNEPLGPTTNLATLFTVSGTAGRVEGSAALAAPAVVTFTPAPPLSTDSIYTVTVNGAVDVAGNPQTVPYTWLFMTLDTVPPVMSITEPPSGSWVGTARPNIRVAVMDALSGILVESETLKLNGELVEPVRAPSSISYTPVADLAQGSHSLTAAVADRAGNARSVSGTFGVDTVPPTAAVITNPTENQVLTGIATITASATDLGSGLAAIDILRDGSLLVTLTAPDFSSSYDTRALGDGPYTLSARAIDAAGNVGLTGTPVHVVVENHPLAVTITSPPAGTHVGDSVLVKAVTSEPVARVEFSAAGSTVADDAAPYEATVSLAGVPDGPVTVTVTAFGLYGETATTTLEIIVDRTTQCVVAPAGLVGWWPGEGSAADIAGNHSGVVQGGLTFVAGAVGRAFSFDGATALVEIPTFSELDTLSAVTIDAWIKPFAFQSPGSVIAGRHSGYQLTLLPDQRLRFAYSTDALAGANRWLDSATPVSANVLTFVAATYDSATGVASIYINGVLDRTAVTGGILTGMPRPFFIGGMSGFGLPVGSAAFTGIIDEVEIFSRALPASEIQRLFAAGSAGQCKGSTGPVVAFDFTQEGNQGWGGRLGNYFDVGSTPILITALGVFDDRANGLTNAIQVGIFNVATSSLVASAVVPPGPTTGTLVDNTRFVPIPPVVLSTGSYAVVAVGFSAADPNYNTNIPPHSPVTVNDGPGLISIPSPNTGFFDFQSTLGTSVAGVSSGPWTFGGGSFQYQIVTNTIARNLTLVSGENQTGSVGHVLASPFVVRVTDINNLPVPNVAVTFTVTAGGGTVSAGQVSTDAQGQASVTLTLGANPGTNTVVATSAGLLGSPVTFNVTAVPAPPALSITKNHVSNFTQGQQGATYTIVVSNGTGAGATNGPVTVTDSVPAGLTLVSMAGAGWQCAATSCTRSDALAGGASYPPIIVTVNVAPDAPLLLVNTVEVSGSGAQSATANDPTTIAPAVPVPNVSGLPRSEAETAIAAAGLTVGLVSEEYSDTTPAGLVIRQVPSAGTYVPEGSAVVLVVSLGVHPGCVDWPSGIVALWAGEGDARELVAGRDGGIFNGVTFAPGKVNQAFSFDDQEGYVLVPHDDALNVHAEEDFTIEAWVNLQGQVPGYDDVILEKRDAQRLSDGRTRSYFRVLADRDTRLVRLDLASEGSVTQVVSNAALAEGAWTHVVVVRQAGVGLIYLNGVLDASGPVTAGTLENLDPLVIGAEFDTATSPPVRKGHGFGGLIDEVTLYKRALSPAEVLDLYDANDSGKCRRGTTLFVTFDGRIADRVGPGGGALSADGKPDAVFTLDLLLGRGVTRELTAVDVTGPGMRSTRPSVGAVLGVARDLWAPLLNGSDGHVALPITTSTMLRLFAADEGLVLPGATYTVTALFSDASTLVGTVTAPAAFPPQVATGPSVIVRNAGPPPSDTPARSEAAGPPVSVRNAGQLPSDTPARSEAAGPPVSVSNRTTALGEGSARAEAVGAVFSARNASAPPVAMLSQYEAAGPIFSVGVVPASGSSRVSAEPSALREGGVGAAVAAGAATTGDMRSARVHHTVSRLPGGRVLVAGGFDGAAYVDRAEIFDPMSRLFTSAASLVFARARHSATELADGRVLIAGGHDANGALQTTEIYDEASGLFVTAAPMHAPRYAHTATTLPDGRVLVAGGRTNDAWLDSCEIYDPTTGLFSAAGRITSPRAGHTASLMPDGRVLITGGTNGGRVLSSAEIYDPAAGVSRPAGPMLAPRAGHMATLLPDGNVLLTGGDDGAAYVNTAEIFKSQTQEFALAGSMSSARGGHTATLLEDGSVLVMGGWAGSGGLATVDTYSPRARVFTAARPMERARAFHGAVLLPDRAVLVVGGVGSGNLAVLSSAEVYRRE